MNNLMNNLLTTMAIVFLLILTLFIFSMLVEYVRFLWMRHKFKKQSRKITKVIDLDGDENELEISEETKEKLKSIFDGILKDNNIIVEDDKKDKENE